MTIPLARRMSCPILIATSALLGVGVLWASISRIVAKEATVYVDANPKSSVLAVLTQGTLVEILQQDGDWSLIKFKDKGDLEKVGYLKSSHVETLGSPARGPSAPNAPSQQASSKNGSVPEEVVAEPGLYYVSPSGIVRIEAKAPYQTRTGSTLVSGLTLGIKPARLNAMLQGLQAEQQVTGSPKFYLHPKDGQSVGEYYLVRFTVKEQLGRREIEVGSKSWYKAQAGFPEKNLYQLETKRLQQNVYLISPKSGLSVGEYGILEIPQITAAGQTSLTPRTIFEFSVR